MNIVVIGEFKKVQLRYQGGGQVLTQRKMTPFLDALKSAVPRIALFRALLGILWSKTLH